MSIDSQTAALDLPADVEDRRRAANAETLSRLTGAEPVLVDVAPAGEVVPGMTASTILTSGAPLEWHEYTGGQRRAVLYATVYEGLAGDPADAEEAIAAGRVRVRSTQQHACIGSVAGIYTASMPVLVVRDETHGNTAFCNLYEGESRHRLNYGSYSEEVVRGLRWLEQVMGPLLAECLRRTGPIRLKPLMARALRLGDELHSRNTAATLLLTRELTPAFLDLESTEHAAAARAVFEFLGRNEYAFLRVGMAAAKATADAAHGIPYSSVLTGMALNCRDFGIRVSGLEDEWFRGAHPRLEGRFFDGFTAADAEWIGGESCVTETIGLGGFAQACAPTLQAYQGGTSEAMRANNEAMYAITVGEHPDFRLPPLDFRGSPIGIDVFAVLGSGVVPVIDGGLAGKDGGQIGAGVLRPDLDCFTDAADAYRRRYVPA
ncbi:DUF1116 domain-containing protein [Geodermatophilus sabuli]|uniref:DUF1116 domain-containing protein n=1 Tax=Geodermatophilus sabuli TaxID=1564158 RepID=A0A285EDT5_9ACTN|nr:DUF1116 domain-containing protein [Geodermatophilus sabuli]MBB3084621.1 hypothetical protein [Geodermatophilus sabuli]SNX97185.1 Protein of unknown function [Geodermatophilus sabuli]